MPSYLSLIRFTEQGFKAIGGSPKRAADFKSKAKKLGVKVRDVYWMLGRYDGCLLFDAPDDETATAAMLQLAAAGNVTTETMRAFTAAEIGSVIEKAGG